MQYLVELTADGRYQLVDSKTGLVMMKANKEMAFSDYLMRVRSLEDSWKSLEKDATLIQLHTYFWAYYDYLEGADCVDSKTLSADFWDNETRTCSFFVPKTWLKANGYDENWMTKYGEENLEEYTLEDSYRLLELAVQEGVVLSGRLWN